MTEEKMREALVKIRDMTGVRGLDPMKREIWNIAHHALIPALSTKQEAGEVSCSQTARLQAMERLQIARLNGLFDASTELTMPGDSDNVPAILDAVEAALSLPAPDAGWRDMLEKVYAVLGAAHSRIHCLPRTSDTELAKRIEQMRAEIEQSQEGAK